MSLKHHAKKAIHVFLPTTPNPTSVFFIFLLRGKTVQPRMTVDEAFNLIIFGGMTTLPDKKARFVNVIFIDVNSGRDE
jgi:uncharacterized membrane protein